MEIDFQRAIQYLGEEIKKLHLDMSIKNAYIDTLSEKIQFLEDKLKKFEPQDKETKAKKKEPNNEV